MRFIGLLVSTLSFRSSFIGAIWSCDSIPSATSSASPSILKLSYMFLVIVVAASFVGSSVSVNFISLCAASIMLCAFFMSGLLYLILRAHLQESFEYNAVCYVCKEVQVYFVS